MAVKGFEKEKNILLQRSPRTGNPPGRYLILLSALLVYILVFPRLYPLIGERMIALSQAVLIGAGALLGLRGGLLFGLMTSAATGFLTTRYAGYTFEDSLTIGIPATLAMLFIGGGVGFCRDLIIKLKSEIKERRRAEDELKKLKEEAEEANRAKSKFLANMSHELRTPLNHIIGFTELVAGKNCGDLNEIQVEYLNDVLMSSRHLLSLINDILDLSKVESGKMELNVSDINPLTLLKNSMSIIKEKAIKYNIRLSLHAEDIPEVIRVDERKFKQIIYNLLSNAIKFTPDGGSVILAASYLSPAHSRLPKPPRREAPPHNDYIEISVKDTGIGISPGDLDGIFAPFIQGRASTLRSSRGTGLGLSLAKKLVELHGGRIWGESEGKGKGSTFKFIIPMSNLPASEKLNSRPLANE